MRCGESLHCPEGGLETGSRVQEAHMIKKVQFIRRTQHQAQLVVADDLRLLEETTMLAKIIIKKQNCGLTATFKQTDLVKDKL